jgi:predicted RNA-binding protein
MKKSTHSKIKNTAILFELLTRQVAADTIKGIDKSPALTLIKEYFKSNSVVAKELVLYQTLVNEKFSTPEKASYLVNTVVKLRNRLDTKVLRDTKYSLIREIKNHYELGDFFKTNLTDYKLYASIYRVFEGVTVSKASEVVNSRFTIIEHLTKKKSNQLQESTNPVGDYLKQDEEIRLLAYKLMIDKFNEKYANLSAKQRSILKEYINNISNTVSLKEFATNEAKQLQTQLKKQLPKVVDKITKIKLNEVVNMLDSFPKMRTIKEEHILSLLLYYELIKELKNVN